MITAISSTIASTNTPSGNPVRMQTKKAIRSLLAIEMLLLLTLTAGRIDAAAPTGKYVESVIQIVFSDETDSDHPLSETDLNNAGPEIQKFFSELSYGKLNMELRFIRVHLKTISGTSGTSATWANYEACGSSCSVFVDAANAALALDSTFTDGAGGVSILILEKYLSRDFTEFAPVNLPGTSAPVVRSKLRELPKNTVNPTGPSQVVWGNWSHEFGHQLEVYGGSFSHGPWLGHPSGYHSGYDLMDSCYPCHESSYGLVDASFVDDPRTVFPGWLDSAHVAMVPVPTSGSSGQTFVLAPISENISTATIQAVKIPIDGKRAYWVNARTRLNSDALKSRIPQGIFSEGVQIQYNDPNAIVPITVCRPKETPICTNTNTDPPNWPYDLWQPGDTFTDSDYSISVHVVKAVTGGYEVNITRDVPPHHPDLFITPWLTPPENTYETVDIWVDSICNGYGVLKYGTRPDNTVIGSGDDPCVNHENKVYATIHNIGDADSAATTATFQVSDPLSVGVSGSWKTIGVAKVPAIFAGGSATVSVDWTPDPDLTAAEIMAKRFGFHSCIQVSVAPAPGEIVTSNNSAQENINYFEVVTQKQLSAGLYQMPVINGAFNLTNSIAGNSQEYSLRVVSNLPEGWTYSINGGAPTVQLLYGQTASIPVQITPPASKPGQIYDLKADALTVLMLEDHGDSHPSWYVAGGVDLNAHTVLPSTLSVSATVNPPGNSLPAAQVTGTLLPAVEGAIVTIDLMDAGGAFSSQVRVGADGKFAALLSPGFFPIKVQAIWQGNVMYASAAASGMVLTSGK